MTGSIRSHADAAAAIDAALGYYRRFEPSSPAILLIEQARSILGKSLFEVISILVPQHAGAARIHVGTEPTFVVPVTQAGGNGSASGGAAEIDPIETRAQAIGLLDQVTLFYRQAEPSSPVPLLLDRAKTLASRDFLSLLKDLLPEEAIKTMKIGG